MGNGRRSNQRTTVLIDRDFQLRFILRLGGALCFYLLLFLVISVVAPVVFTFLGDPPEWALMETAFRVEVLLRLMLAPLVCTFLCLFVHGVMETFRIAGPNYRYKAVMRDMARLRLPRGVATRKGDLLQDTTAEFDRALVAIHDQIAAVRDDARQAAEKTGAALGALRGEAAEEAFAALDALERRLAAFELVSRAPACEPIASGAPVVSPTEPEPASAAP